MRITDAKVIICSPGRNFVTLKLITEDGLYGLGDATLNGRELAVASYLTDHVVPSLIGRDARKIEDIWQYFYKGAYWRRGPVIMSAISAVDTALWDIKAKSLNAPLYQLLGGASCDAVLVYGHASGAGIEDTVTAVAHYLKLGYKAIRAQSEIPGLESTDGVGRGQMHYEPAEKGLPPGNHWSSEKYLNFVPQLFTRLRKEFAPDVHLAARRASPADSHRGCARGQRTRAVSFVLAGGSNSCGIAGRLSPDSAATAQHRGPSVKCSIRFTIASSSSRNSSSTIFAPRWCTPAASRT